MTPGGFLTSAVCTGILLVLVAISLSPAWAPDARVEDRPKPFGGLAAEEQFLLECGRRVALAALATRSACRSLFSRLGGDGVDLVEKLRFRRVEGREESDRCTTATVAMVTRVGDSTIGVCPARLERLSSRAIAVLVLHEALHSAGRPEGTRDFPDTPIEISQRIRNACFDGADL